MKGMISISILIFSSLGSWVGALMDHNNWFGAASLLLGVIGSFAGVWIGYKAGQHLGY